MSTDALFQLGIASVRLNTSLTEIPQELPRTPVHPGLPSCARASRRPIATRLARAPHEAPPRCGKPGFGLMARAVRHGRTPPEN